MVQKNPKIKQKIIVIYGPTSSGKSDYAVKLALEIGKDKAKIISADSRQVYKELNLLSGKVTKAEMLGVKHHMLSIVSLVNIKNADFYSASDYANSASQIVLGILESGKTPIVCGGTGFYIQALVNKLNNTSLPEVPPNKKLREKLNKLNTTELFEILKNKDAIRAKSIDSKNKVRLIRALEIIETLGMVPVQGSTLHKNKYEIEWVRLDLDNTGLKNKIEKRLAERISLGMLDEAQKVYKLIGSEKMQALGLECKYSAMFIEGEINLEELKTILPTKIWQYAKRQRTWFKKQFN
ncbi:tRNA (adenosine(37)-N6)-dimethylallyltransferase MiaA [Candidatus Nomurabacteria bacterium RIFCSPHIGHO2_02_FULL_38_15]|uniref:tRNA dimethylallyltransferase n=1 Tax=Candidatus Nomurabacteria bacterium RIFCSPHIGHO2_02_FULL_38_15 TaxID=1801752 RepID=A0A1F6VQL0_9BACT|nr:MAG: tRNA (adenosine(37)-N6)-dimethylallyltransferase MiaA [Candidatus Nomurabacteria bacterium RIFCSPHIGHO2_02_FULL_38_15]